MNFVFELWPSPDPHLTLTWPSPDLNLTLTWPGPGPELDKKNRTGNFASGVSVRVRHRWINQIYQSSAGLFLTSKMHGWYKMGCLAAVIIMIDTPSITRRHERDKGQNGQTDRRYTFLISFFSFLILENGKKNCNDQEDQDHHPYCRDYLLLYVQTLYLDIHLMVSKNKRWDKKMDKKSRSKS